jgi:hypothetical protein
MIVGEAALCLGMDESRARTRRGRRPVRAQEVREFVAEAHRLDGRRQPSPSFVQVMSESPVAVDGAIRGGPPTLGHR